MEIRIWCLMGRIIEASLTMAVPIKIDEARIIALYSFIYYTIYPSCQLNPDI